MVTLAVAGDIYPGKLSAPLLSSGDLASVFGGLLGVLSNAHLCIANLEGPLANISNPISKIGPLHAIPEDCVRGLRAAGLNVLNLGNNHIMDQGFQGLSTTLRLCEQHGISVVGAGENVAVAGRRFVQQVEGLRIGFLSYSEHEFGMASETEPGAHPLSLIHFVRTVATQHEQWDYLLVLLHGGNEYYPYPRPDLQEICRFMIEQGADAVICQHSHCAGCYEAYQHGHIVYGQGNLLFDERSSRPCEQEGFLVVLEIESGRPARLRPVPFFQSASRPGPDLDPVRAPAFLQDLEQRSKEILRPAFVRQQWQAYCQANADRYLGLLLGYGRKVREWDRKLHFLRFLRSNKRLRMLLHLLRCESHREVIIGSLDEALKQPAKDQ